jgi:DNA-binding Xre family transcriptional regulator
MNVNLLKGKMAEKQITQGLLAKEIGISENSLSRKLLGKREFRLSEAVAICKVLEIDNPKEIFFGDSVPNTQHKTAS